VPRSRWGRRLCRAGVVSGACDGNVALVLKARRRRQLALSCGRGIHVGGSGVSAGLMRAAVGRRLLECGPASAGDAVFSGFLFTRVCVARGAPDLPGHIRAILVRGTSMGGRASGPEGGEAPARVLGVCGAAGLWGPREGVSVSLAPRVLGWVAPIWGPENGPLLARRAANHDGRCSARARRKWCHIPVPFSGPPKTAFSEKVGFLRLGARPQGAPV